MATLHEISGAKERPFGCQIEVNRDDDGTIRIIIPPRGVPAMVVVTCGLFLFFLLLMAYMGAMLFFAHRSVLFMAEISPGDLPVPLRPARPLFGLGWVIVEALGFLALAGVARRIFVRETLTQDAELLHRTERLLGSTRRQTERRADVRGYLLTRDPQGFTPSVLTLESRGAHWTIGEYLSETDREWLESAGNALLRNY